MIIEQTQTIDANDRGVQGAACPPGTLRLTGSCTTANINPLRDVVLEQSGFYSASDQQTWTCFFRNNEATPVTVKASVVCLMPGS